MNTISYVSNQTDKYSHRITELDRSTRISIKRYLENEEEAFQAILEKRLNGVWKAIASYRTNSEVSTRSLNRCSGVSQTMRMSIPTQVIRDMAIADFGRNWEKYLAYYQACCKQGTCTIET